MGAGLAADSGASQTIAQPANQWYTNGMTNILTRSQPGLANTGHKHSEFGLTKPAFRGDFPGRLQTPHTLLTYSLLIQPPTHAPPTRRKNWYIAPWELEPRRVHFYIGRVDLIMRATIRQPSPRTNIQTTDSETSTCSTPANPGQSPAWGCLISNLI
jgi:hypothetical protein